MAVRKENHHLDLGSERVNQLMKVGNICSPVQQITQQFPCSLNVISRCPLLPKSKQSCFLVPPNPSVYLARTLYGVTPLLFLSHLHSCSTVPPTIPTKPPIPIQVVPPMGVVSINLILIQSSWLLQPSITLHALKIIK